MKEELKTTKIPRNIWAMGWVSMLNDIASEMIYPIVPIFLKSVLGAPAIVIGLIEGIAESTASFLKLISGWLSDKLRERKAFVVFGYFLSAVSKLIMAVAQMWPLVLFARFVDRFGKGTRTSARDALIVESIDSSIRGRAFGLHRAMDSFGAVIGPLLALLLMSAFAEDYRKVFFLSFFPAIVGVLILLVFVKEKKRDRSAIAFKQLNLKFKWKDLNPNLRLFLIVSAIFSLGNSSDAFLILRSQDIGLTATLTVAAYVLYNIFYTIFSYPAGVASDKIGPKRILAASFFLFSLVYLGFGLVNQQWMIWALFPIYGLYIALTDGVSRAYIATMVMPEKSGTAFGAYQMILGFGTFLSSFVAGMLWSYVSPSAPFLFGSITALLAGLIFMFSKKPKSVQEQLNI